MPGSVNVRPYPTGRAPCRQTAFESNVSRICRFIVHRWPRQNTTVADSPVSAAFWRGLMRARDIGAEPHRVLRAGKPDRPRMLMLQRSARFRRVNRALARARRPGSHRRVRRARGGSQVADHASVAVVSPARRRDLLLRIRYTEKDSPYHRAASPGPACRAACHAGTRADRPHALHITYESTNRGPR